MVDFHERWRKGETYSGDAFSLSLFLAAFYLDRQLAVKWAGNNYSFVVKKLGSKLFVVLWDLFHWLCQHKHIPICWLLAWCCIGVINWGNVTLTVSESGKLSMCLSMRRRNWFRPVVQKFQWLNDAVSRRHYFPGFMGEGWCWSLLYHLIWWWERVNVFIVKSGLGPLLHRIISKMRWYHTSALFNLFVIVEPLIY